MYFGPRPSMRRVPTTQTILNHVKPNKTYTVESPSSQHLLAGQWSLFMFGHRIFHGNHQLFTKDILQNHYFHGMFE